MSGKSVTWAPMTISGGAIICVMALAGWWFVRMPPRPATLMSLTDSAQQAPLPSPAASGSNAPTSPAVTLSADIVRVTPIGDVVVAGRTEPGAKVSLLDQGALLAEMTGDPTTGEFVFLPPRLSAGEHKLSLKSTTMADSGRSAESAVWTFSISPANTASNAALPSPSTTAIVPVGDRAAAVAARSDMTTIARGNTLWQISRTRLGRGVLYSTIYQANSTKIHDPNLIYPGQVITIP